MPMTPYLQRGCLILASAVLSACGSITQTPYSRPDTATPAQWTQAGAPADADAGVAIEQRWWSQFGDSALDRVIDEALARNNNLAAATIRVRRAQLQADLARNALVPSIGASVSSGVSQSLKSGGPSSRSNSASLSSSYEVDLWGRLDSQRDAAVWQAQATAQDRQASELVLIGTTAGLYWQLGYLNQRIAAGEQSIRVAEQTLAFVQAQYRAGAVSALEPSDAQQNLASQQANQAGLIQQRVETRNALAIVFDQAPGTLSIDPPLLTDHPIPDVAAGVPADLLRRRPDLRAAELRLRATLADNDALRASYYPRLSLTASAGSSSISLLDVLKNPIGSLGAGLSLPFLQVNQMRLNNAIAASQFEEAVVNFRQTLLQAFVDVENALAARRTLAEQARLQQISLDTARTSERLYEVRYKAGATPLRTWLDAQERRRSAEISLALVRLDQLNAQVALYQALGGSDRE